MSYSPMTGNVIGEDGRLYNLVELLGGGTPLDDLTYDPSSYAPMGGNIIGPDGRLYSIVQLIQARNAALNGALDTLDQGLADVAGDVAANTSQLAAIGKPITTYTHTTNREVVVSSVDIDTKAFTSAAHGLNDGDAVAAILNMSA